MSSNRSSGWLQRFIAYFKPERSKKFSGPPELQETDREYIEGESPQDIGRVGQETNIPDKADRLPKHIRIKSKSA